MTSYQRLLHLLFIQALLFAFFLVSFKQVHAGGLQINYQGMRQTGMANTGVGLALDGSSIFINPGALAMGYQGGILLGSSSLIPRTTYFENRFDFDTYYTTERFVVTPIYLYAAFKGKEGSKWEKFTYGISLNNPFGGRSKWNDDWKGQNISREFSMNTFFVQPTISYQLTENIGIGAGLSYGVASILSRKSVDAAGGGSVQFSGQGTSIGFNLGLFAQITQEVSLGASFRSSLAVEIDQGLVQFSVPASLADRFSTQDFKTDFTLPRILSFGLGYKPNERTQFALDVVFAGWNVYDSLDLRLVEPKLIENNFPTRNYTNSISIRSGAEYAISDALLMRMGIYYDGSPVPSEYVTPEFPDANRLGLSVGLGLRFGQKISLDFSSTYDFTGERTAEFDEAQFQGVYNSNTYTFGLGLGYFF